MDPVLSLTPSQRLHQVRERIAAAARRAGRDPADITLLAASKGHAASELSALFDLGQRQFGESYVQEARDKQSELASLPLEWHFIGHVQSNKAKYVVGNFQLIHTVDSVKLAQALHAQAERRQVRQAVLLQVNIGEEASKSGAAADELERLALEVRGLSGLEVCGLMCLPPFFSDPELARPYFVRLRELRDLLAPRLGQVLPQLSMGMSLDLEVAVEEGATIVRVGTDLLGPRRV